MIQIGYPMRTFNLYQQVYDQQGNPINGVYVDRNNDGQITADDRYLGHHADADWTFGFNTALNWKNWTAALSGHASLGNWVYNNVASDTEMLADLWTNQFVSNRVATAPRQLPQAGQLHPGLHVPETVRRLARPSLLPECLRHGAEHLHVHPLHGHRP